MDILQGLEYVRAMAKAYDTYGQTEAVWAKRIQPLKPIYQIREVEVQAKEKYRNWAIFGACEVALAYIINTTLELVVNYFLNDCMTQEQAIAAGHIGYHTVTLFFGVGAVVALPLAWLAKKLICGILDKLDKSETARAKKANEEKRQHNLRAEEENKIIAQNNSKCEAEIDKIRKEKRRLVKELKEKAPWYETAYFSVEAVDYVTAQIKNGRARNLEEAYAQYETSCHR